MPLVSIVVPAYNAERWIGSCVRSVLGQTHRALELLLIDDGSTSGQEALAELVRGERRLRVVHQPNLGLSGARNRGIDLVQGDYVGFLDADDLLSPRAVERCVAALEADPAAALVRFDMTSDEAELAECAPPNPQVWDDPVAGFLALPPQRRWASSCTALYRRGALAAHRFRLGLNYEDVDFWLRLLRRTRRCLHLPAPFYFYRQHADSFVHTTLTAAQLHDFDAIARGVALDFRDDPVHWRGVRRGVLQPLALIFWKAIRKWAPGSGPTPRRDLGRLTEGWFRDGTLRLSDFPPKWRLRLLPRWLRAKAHPRLIAWCCPRLPARPTILMLHTITDTPSEERLPIATRPSELRRLIADLLASGYAFQTLTDAFERPLGRPTIVLTFDDGFADVYTELFPILREFGVPATCFLTDLKPPEYLADWQTRALDASGLVEIGGHTSSHPWLPSEPIAAQRRQIEDNKRRLEALLGHPIHTFAYPSGAYSQEAAAILREAGYRRAVVTRNKGAPKGDFFLQRLEIPHGAGRLDAYLIATRGRCLRRGRRLFKKV